MTREDAIRELVEAARAVDKEALPWGAGEMLVPVRSVERMADALATLDEMERAGAKANG